MSSTYKAYSLDPKSETDGVWQTMRSGARVKIRYENSFRVQEAARRLDRKYRALMMSEGGLPANIQAEREAALCASDIVADWEGVTDENDNPIPFSGENVLKVLTDLPEFRRDIVYMARLAENFRLAEQAELAKN